jgi:glycosyltransferase involved in cell wall biosynthesis
MKNKLAIIATHPVQYSAPIFRALASHDLLDVRVYYTWSQTASGEQADRGFGRTIRWDIPLLEGYAHEFVPNIANRPGPDRFWGLRNPTLIGNIERWSPDALLVYGWNSFAHLQVLRHFSGLVPILFRGDSTLLDPQPPLRALARRALLSWVYRYIDVALAVGRNSHDYFKWCGLPSERIVFAPHSIDIVRFSNENASHVEQARAWRRELAIAESSIAIVFAGKLQEKKNPMLLLDAFMRLNDRSHLIFVGSGELESRLRERAGCCPNIHFLPFQNQSLMPAVYRLADLFVLPSCGPGETWGLALNEAMASNCAVAVSSRVGAAADLVRDRANGWVFESGNLVALVNILREAATLGRERLRHMGEIGGNIISHWSTEECASRIGAAVMNLILTLEKQDA